MKEVALSTLIIHRDGYSQVTIGKVKMMEPEICIIHDIEMNLVYDGPKIRRWKCPKCGSEMKVRKQ